MQKIKQFWAYLHSEAFAERYKEWKVMFFNTSAVSKSTIHAALYFGIAGLYLTSRIPPEVAFWFRMVAELLAFILISWSIWRMLGGISQAQGYNEYLDKRVEVLQRELEYLEAKVAKAVEEKKPSGD